MLDFTAPSETDCALALCCDATYLPYSLHLAHQIVLAHPQRDFDVLIASAEPLALPDWAARAGIRNLVVEETGGLSALPLHRLPRATYLRLAVPGHLAGRYRRLLYLDGDMFLERGGLDRLLRLDLGPHVLGAVQDVDPLLQPGFHASEFSVQGLGALPYFNAGLLVIDLPGWQREEVLARGIDLATRIPAVMRLHDQSLLNGVLRGGFAELSPVWNWMCNQRFALLTRSYPPRLRHFIGGTKPWSDPNGRHDARFAASYAEFFRRWLPEAPTPVTAPAGLRLMAVDAMARLVLDQHRMRKRLAEQLGRFRDDWDVKQMAGSV
ncbi:MAG: glycosyltransferase [Rhodobacteraceae bacterium]|nr:glycosyltransferase [Paracoccaceae bacterium]